MIDRERINRQLALLCEKVIVSCVDPRGDQQLMLRGSTVNFNFFT